MATAVSIKDLVVRYGQITAVEKCNLDIEENEIFGLLGPNGAGKSSIMKVISGQLSPSEGSLSLWKENPSFNSDYSKKMVGIVPQDYSFAFDFTVEENIKYLSRLYGFGGLDLMNKVEMQLNNFMLSKFKDKPAHDLSGGYKRLLNFALSTIHSPKLLLLDEPTVGLDPDMRERIWLIIKLLKESGNTLVLTTHYLEEASFLCDRIAIIYKGKIMVIGSPNELIDKYGGNTKIFLQLSKIAQSIIPLAKRIKGVVDSTSNDNVLSVECTNREVIFVISKLQKLLDDENIQVKNSLIKEPVLDDVFKSVVGTDIGVK
jgi:ABC-2 type transport system ATP-binding protein